MCKIQVCCTERWLHSTTGIRRRNVRTILAKIIRDRFVGLDFDRIIRDTILRLVESRLGKVVLITWQRDWFSILLVRGVDCTAVFVTRGRVHTQHVHKFAPLRLQLLYLTLKVLVLCFKNFWFLYQNHCFLSLF